MVGFTVCTGTRIGVLRCDGSILHVVLSMAHRFSQMN